MILEVWIVMDQAALNALQTANDPMVTQRGARGYWKDISPDEVINVIAEEADLNQFIADNSADITATYAWVQGPGFDSLDVWPTDPTAVLSLMADHDSGPATFNNPNWGHVFLGQDERIFAGNFSDAFNEGFL